MEFSSPSQIYVRTLVPTPVLQEKLHTPSFKMFFIFHPPSSECAEFWSPAPRYLPLPPLEELMTGPLRNHCTANKQYRYIVSKPFHMPRSRPSNLPPPIPLPTTDFCCCFNSFKWAPIRNVSFSDIVSIVLSVNNCCTV